MKLTAGKLALIIMVLGFIGYKHYGNVNYAWFGLLAGLLVWSMDAQIKAWKYESPTVVTATGSWSFDHVYKVGEYVVIPLGAVKTDGIYLEGGTGLGGEGFLIVPAASAIALGTNYVILSDPVESDMEELPPEVADFIEGVWGLKDDMKFLYSETVIPLHAFEDPDMEAIFQKVQARMQERVKSLNKLISIYKEIMNGRYDALLEAADTLGFIDSKLRRTTQGELIKELLKKPSEED